MNFKRAFALGLLLVCVQDTKPYGNPIPHYFGEIFIAAPLATGALAYVAWAPGGAMGT